MFNLFFPTVLESQSAKAGVPIGRTRLVFSLPTVNRANKISDQWINAAGINKHVTWSCARLSFSILLQDQNIDDATVAYLMGHTTTNQVRRI
jgi:hypothetical protein